MNNSGDMTMRTGDARAGTTSDGGWLLAPYARGRTYRSAGYLLLGLPMGVISFTAMVVGLALGAGLFVTLLGIPILTATLLTARRLANFEGRIAAGLLGTPTRRPTPVGDEANGMWWPRLREISSDGRSWADVVYLLLRLPLGVLDFVVAGVVIGFMFIGLGWPILVAAGATTEIGSWTIDTTGESLVFLPLGVLFALIGPHMILGWARVSGRITTALLGSGADAG